MGLANPLRMARTPAMTVVLTAPRPTSRMPSLPLAGVISTGFMAGEKWDHAIEALDRFLLDLLQPQDEVFLYRFSNDPVLVQDWTTDRMLLSQVLKRVVPRGGTAMYDAVAEAVPLADTGHNRKKAIVVISDGNDNRSQTSVSELKHMARSTRCSRRRRTCRRSGIAKRW